MLTELRKEKLIELCQELIRNPSVSGGGEEKVAKAIEKKFKEFGFDDCFIDAYGNIIGHIKGSGEGGEVILSMGI